MVYEWRIGALGLACLVAAVAGCGGAKPEPAVKAGGKVAYKDGGPVTNLAVVLQPEGEKAYSPRGRLDKEGVFSLTTYAENDGAPVGKYRVYFVPDAPESLQKGPPSGPPATPPPDPGAGGAPPAPPMPVRPSDVVATSYLDPKNTPLVLEIAADKDNSRLELKVDRPGPGK